jgi:hypothetical protein
MTTVAVIKRRPIGAKSGLVLRTTSASNRSNWTLRAISLSQAESRRAWSAPPICCGTTRPRSSKIHRSKHGHYARFSFLHVIPTRDTRNHSGGVVSTSSTSAGKTIQCSAERVHTWTVGLIQFGSSKVPALIPRAAGAHSAVYVTVVPHVGQNSNLSQRLLSSERHS